MWYKLVFPSVFSKYIIVYFIIMEPLKKKQDC